MTKIKKVGKKNEVWTAAIAGDALSQFTMGERYKNGEGVTKDASEAVVWYKKAAEQGLASAQCSLGQLFLHGDDPTHEPEDGDAPGIGITRDVKLAVSWLRKAAAQGDITAQFSLGALYKRGCEGVEANAAEAVAWFQKAADQGMPRVRALVQLIFSCSPLFLEASRACSHAHPSASYTLSFAILTLTLSQAQCSLGQMYLHGSDGVEKDTEKARQWLEKAAAQEHTFAKHLLAQKKGSAWGSTS
jgi:TPR repeat protein